MGQVQRCFLLLKRWIYNKARAETAEKGDRSQGMIDRESSYFYSITLCKFVTTFSTFAHSATSRSCRCGLRACCGFDVSLRYESQRKKEISLMSYKYIDPIYCFIVL
jgi:hypothetical protein